MVATLIRRSQIVTSVIAIGIIVWIGLIMVLPVSAEMKESAKSKVFSVVLGFLFMISATIIVNALINIVYEIFK
jgi:ABC-type Fe3+-siderophore transport system permease subunit